MTLRQATEDKFQGIVSGSMAPGTTYKKIPGGQWS